MVRNRGKNINSQGKLIVTRTVIRDVAIDPLDPAWPLAVGLEARCRGQEIKIAWSAISGGSEGLQLVVSEGCGAAVQDTLVTDTSALQGEQWGTPKETFSGAGLLAFGFDKAANTLRVERTALHACGSEAMLIVDVDATLRQVAVRRTRASLDGASGEGIVAIGQQRRPRFELREAVVESSALVGILLQDIDGVLTASVVRGTRAGKVYQPDSSGAPITKDWISTGIASTTFNQSVAKLELCDTLVESADSALALFDTTGTVERCTLRQTKAGIVRGGQQPTIRHNRWEQIETRFVEGDVLTIPPPTKLPPNDQE